MEGMPVSLRSFVDACLGAAALAGASYTDVRVVDTATQSISVRTGRVEGIESSTAFGFGVRVIANGAWGFASSSEVTFDTAERIAREAVAIAKASALAPGAPVRLSDVGVYEDVWTGACGIDPFAVSIEDKLAILLAADEAMRRESAVKVAEASMSFLRITKTFGSSLGSYIEQSFVESGAGITAYAVGDGEVLPRSYPNSHGGQHMQGGWETITALDLPGNAPRVAEQAAALLTAKPCPSGRTTVIIGGSQLGLQVHESIGHPTELDRVLGDEAAFAGTSFLTLDDVGKLRYGSEHVTVTADATVAGSLGSFGYDDEGVPAQRDVIIDRGLLQGFLSSREGATVLGRTSNGCMRADGWNRIPIIRMTTVSLEPGSGSLADLIADTDEGIYLETSSSWSIDDRRLNFQFATEIGWEIRGGKLGAMIKNPNYTGITPQFWGGCDAVCGPEEWQVWGLPNCGKGQPMQLAHVAHGAAPARFRHVEVGVGR
jgi:TldD protein